MTLVVKALSEEEFYSLEEDWARLLRFSNADPLFMSWPWLYSWWETWGECLGLELVLLGVYLPDNKLVGIAPLYRHRFRIAIGMNVTRLHFLGNAWRVSPTVRTEYVGLIAEPERESDIAQAVATFLRAEKWDELVIPDSQQIRGGLFGKALTDQCGAVPILRSESYGIRVDTSGSFQPWVESLGASTRLKAFNRRALFENVLGGHWKPVGKDKRDQSGFMEALNNFHKLRWGKPCFDGKALQFHLTLLSRLSSDQKPELSSLMVDGAVVSVLYDIKAGEAVYNLQAGFDESLHRKLSLGTLHLGYAIERAFLDSSVCGYDLLAGSGKNTFYKARFHGQHVDFPTLDFVRSPLLRAAYRCRPYLPANLVSRINRVFRL